MFVVENEGSDLGKAGGAPRRLDRTAGPQQIEITGQLVRTMQDAGDLSDHDGARAVTIECREKSQRIEADRFVAGDRSQRLVGIVVRNSKTRMPHDVVGDASNGVVESFEWRHRTTVSPA